MFEGWLVVLFVHVGMFEAIEAAGIVPGCAEKFG